MQTGRLFQGGSRTSQYGCVLSKLKGPKGDVPPHVLLPRPIGNTGAISRTARTPGTWAKPSTRSSLMPTVRSELPRTGSAAPDYLTALRVDRRRNWREMVDKSVSEFEPLRTRDCLDSTFHQALHVDVSQKAARRSSCTASRKIS